MSTQPIQVQDKKPTEPSSRNNKEWQILAEEASQENDPDKLMEVVESLTRAVFSGEGL